MTIVQKERFIKNEMPFGNLPEGWESTSLKTVATLKKGKKPYKVDKTTWPGAVPYIDIEAFEKGNIRRYADQESSALVNEGDIIVVWDGARCGHVGKTPERGALGSTLGTIQPILIHPDYILRFLQLSYESINTNPRGIGIPHVEPDLFWNLEIPLAPLAEQKRIVAKVEELLTRVNTTKERLAKVAMILKRFRQAVLAAACSGRLTADWREINPDLERFSEFLIRIGKGLKKKLLENSTSVQTEKNEVPNSWDHVELGAALESLSNGIYKPESFYSTDGVICLRMYNIQNGKIIWRNLKRMILTPEEIEKYSLKPGDMLVNRVNSRELVGKAAIIEEIEQPVVFESKNIRLRFIGKDTLPKFINFCFMTRMVRDVLEHSAKQTVGMATISQPQISKLILPIPPVEEQKEIVRRVEALFNKADEIEARFKKAKAFVDKLTQSILSKAFRGELVPTEAELARCECRSYEPASELLARIKSQRESKGASKLTPRNRNQQKARRTRPARKNAGDIQISLIPPYLVKKLINPKG